MTYKEYETHKLDTQTQVFFYEQEFYVLSNFSSFQVRRAGRLFPTSEHAYHWEKFPNNFLAQAAIERATSAHVVFETAQNLKSMRRPDWDTVKYEVMRQILWAKVHQHEYVGKKLMETGTRELIEDSWRDDVWGWGPNHDGQNLLGKCWMEIRDALTNHMDLYPTQQWIKTGYKAP